MNKEIIITKKIILTESDLLEHIETFFKIKGIKAGPNHRIQISHDLTEDLANFLYERIQDNKTNNKYEKSNIKGINASGRMSEEEYEEYMRPNYI